jgi:hypothetical protein
LALAVVIAVGGLLRLATLDVQHFWVDEAVTAGLMRLDLGDMLAAISTTESTPPLYYLLARGWAGLFGTGEVGLRSLSALFGTLTIPVVYAIGATLASRRAGLVAAALAAVSPALVWYSQEARSYALVILLGALSLLFAARALRGDNDPDLVWWGLTAVLAVLTHYFAGFLVAGEALWLLAAHPRRRDAALGVAAVAACGAALLPLAIHQSGQGNLDFISDVSLATRLVDTAQLFLAGPTGDRVDLAVALVAVTAVLALVLAFRAAPPERLPARVLAAVAVAGIAAPVALAILGADYLLARNLLPLWLPLAAAAAIGLSAERSGRLGLATTIALLAGSVWLVALVPLDRTLQREAITALLVGRQLNAENERIDPRIGYATGDAGRKLRAGAACDEGYIAETGGATLRRGSDQAAAGSRGSRRRWSATARPAADGSVLSVYAICVRPLD